ncbi:epimerase [Thioalkalivibrio denitrificans]|uniref:Epimerase n=1 Tax=Thioalkalivibrio denitrificans TaxID=108003 RepID=A0A1V3NFB1_9GAMM|nr:complex I NDUFA9 subunit family protein [Thioalkalivibrio denitrificans]OOG23715.1 epimerase [Thioalkalivibrio denitrificans]
MSARAVVLGGTGFLGRAVVRRLMESGWTVRCVARHADRAAKQFPADSPLELRAADIGDEDGLREVLQDADGVVNVVSLYVEQGGATFEAIHVHGAQRLARLAREAGVPALVHVSGLGVDETSPSSYVRARARGERCVREVLPEAVIMRPSVLFGPGDAFLRSLEMITRRLPVIPLFGDGSTRLQPVYVEDVAAAIAQALVQPDARGRVFELGGARVHTYREIVVMVLRHFGLRRLLMPVPFALWHGLAATASLLPAAPLTRDQVWLLQSDNVVAADASTFADLGVEPQVLETLLPECLGV